MYRISAVVPTLNRPTLERSIASMSEQSRIPDEVIIVSDQEIQPLHGYLNLNITYLVNTRTGNLSGAINSGLEYLLRNGWEPETTYVAVLDDDDEWEPDYLEKCLDAGIGKDLDLVFSGIIRHSTLKDEPKLSIPKILSPDVFLTGNPHIQGSNLFVKLSVLLMAGAFDERLVSTTDRDICYRLFDLGISYGVIEEHLVHQWALPESNRLSEPGSEKKRRGLTAFFEKYSPIMKEEQKIAFLERATKLFNTEITLTRSVPDIKAKSKAESNLQFPVIIGFTATNLETADRLLEDLHVLFNDYQKEFRIVVCDNSDDLSKLETLLETHVKDHYRLYSKEQITNDCIQGVFGEYLIKEENMGGIASGRTVLHKFLYNEMKNTPGSVAWILDDDVRLESIQLDGSVKKITIKELNQKILYLKNQGVPIANGRITGDPPVPHLSTLRTQLLDIYFNILRIKNADDHQKTPGRIFHENFDYYYDLSEIFFTHLETPKYLDKVTNPDQVVKWFRKLLQGKNASRYLTDIPTHGRAEGRVPPRGGNTLVLNPNCLRNYPNITPRMKSVNLRRGDTFWCLLNYHHGGMPVSEAGVSVRHDRVLDRESAFSFERLKADFYGSSFLKAMEEYLEMKNEMLGWNPRRIKLEFNDYEIDEIIALFEYHLERRLANFIMNAYRIKGIINNILKHTVNPNLYLHNIQEDVKYLESLYDVNDLKIFIKNLKDYKPDELKAFLKNMSKYIKSYRVQLSDEINLKEIEHSFNIMNKIGLSGVKELRKIGYGHEGVVYTDGNYIYKHFFLGKTGFPQGRFPFLKEQLLKRTDLRHYSSLLDIIEEDGELVLKFPYGESQPYDGGRLKEFLDFLIESRESRVLTTNVHPKNMVIQNGILKLVDIGRSIIPYNEKEFREMCKRAYLTYRWHFRDDLNEVMNTALSEESIPELFGFQWFLDSIEMKTKEGLVNQVILDSLSSEISCTVLDYGCGSGKISEDLSNMGFSVVGYDIDEVQIDINKQRSSDVTYIGPNEIDDINDVTFDKVLCVLVLCTIESENELTHAIKDLRRFIHDSGEVIVVICNPFFSFVKETETHRKIDIPDSTNYRKHFSYTKEIKKTGNFRTEFHRPFSYYEHIFKYHGLDIEEVTEIGSVDIENLSPSSDFLLIRLNPLNLATDDSVSLVINASAMEWRTIDFQIRHIVRQLEGPQHFLEKIIVTDEYPGPFSRQYSEPNFENFYEKIEKLQDDGIINRIVVVDNNPLGIKETIHRWFNIDTTSGRCANGQPTYTILKGFEEAQGDYILQVDSDCIIVRTDRDHDYLADMIALFETDPETISVSFNIAHDHDIEYSHEKEGIPWRIEARFSLLKKQRLLDSLSLSNALNEDGKLVYPWHRALDIAVRERELKSYRGGDRWTFFIHVPNSVKTELNHWYNIIKVAEMSLIPESQYDHVDLVSLKDWIKPVDENFIFIMRGLNTPVSKLKRGIASLLAQDRSDWQIVFIDAGSSNPMSEYLEKVVIPELSDKCTFWFNFETLTSMENIFIVSSELCTNPESVLIHVDADDAIIGPHVLSLLSKQYQNGADVTVGSMLRTDKQSVYPVNFNPRDSRGGNVWQHLRSYKKHLFDGIPPEYFMVNGDWVPMAEDWAFMLPIVELAKKPVWIKEPIYFYEPSIEKMNQLKLQRENIIRELVTKPSLRPGDAL